MSFKWLATLLVGILCGGLGGAVFTWWVSHPRPAVFAYSISTTTTGTEPGVHALVPNLTLQLGDEKIKAIHTHAIALTPARTYERAASIGIFFGTAPRIFGTAVETPSPLHSGRCEQFDRGLKCLFSPLDPRSARPYRILVASDVADPPTLATIDQRIELIPIQQLAAWNPRQLLQYGAVIFAVSISGAFIFIALLDSVMVKLRPTTWKRIMKDPEREIRSTLRERQAVMEEATKLLTEREKISK
jgi:hypothetical protein